MTISIPYEEPKAVVMWKGHRYEASMPEISGTKFDEMSKNIGEAMPYETERIRRRENQAFLDGITCDGQPRDYYDVDYRVTDRLVRQAQVALDLERQEQ